MANQIPVLSWAIYENLSDHHEFLQKLKLFAVAQGWTCSKEEISKVWTYSGGVYTWTAGAEDFMEFTSTGFGSQNLIFRIRLRDTGSGNAQQLTVGGHKYDTYNTASSTHPVDKNGTGDKWNYPGTGEFSVKRTSIPAVWFFGNSKVIFWVMKLDSTTCQSGCFGSLNSFYPSETELDWIGALYPEYRSWEKKDYIYSVFDGTGTMYQGGIYFRSGHNYNISRIVVDYLVANSAYAYFSANAFYPVGTAIKRNLYSSVRAIAEQTIYGLNSSGIWQPLGTYWAGRLYTYGLDIGEHIKYGTEEYIAFPVQQTTNFLGYALRIN